VNHYRFARWTALTTGAPLCALGVIHDLVNIPSLNRAAARGEIAPRLLPELLANVAFGGLALSLLGALLVLIAPELEKGKQIAWRIGLAIGAFFLLCGLAAYLWLPEERVLVFALLGGVVCGPLLKWHKEFLSE